MTTEDDFEAESFSREYLRSRIAELEEVIRRSGYRKERDKLRSRVAELEADAVLRENEKDILYRMEQQSSARVAELEKYVVTLEQERDKALGDAEDLNATFYCAHDPFEEE